MSSLAKDRERWRAASLVDRIEHFGGHFVFHPNIINIKADLEDKEETSRVLHCGDGLFIQGEPGSGKTTIANAISEWWPDIVTPELTCRPVALMRIPKPCTSSNLVKELLRAIGDPNWNASKERIGRDRALWLMEKCKTRFLVVDNFQDVPERRDIGGVRVIGNWFRDIRDDAKIVLVVLGTKEAADVTLHNDQVKRRVMTTRHLRYFSIDKREDRERWMRLLHEIDLNLPLAESSSLASGNIAGRLLVATNGIFDYLSKLLVAAIKLVVKEGRESISMEDFQRAYIKCHGDIPEGTNPFEDSFKIRRLDRVDEPFYRPVTSTKQAVPAIA